MAHTDQHHILRPKSKKRDPLLSKTFLIDCITPLFCVTYSVNKCMHTIYCMRENAFHLVCDQKYVQNMMNVRKKTENIFRVGKSVTQGQGPGTSMGSSN